MVAAGFAFGLSRAEWIGVILCIALVMAAELTNTALERLADAVTDSPHPLIRIAKDCSAAAVLVVAAASALIGLLIFVPKIAAHFAPPP
ncbi:hypothetical protein BH23VER1_BH23VER1_08380 [soil metagenome]